MKILLALEAGMPQFIPLSLLTAKACRDALRMASLDHSAKHALQLEGNAITVKAAAFDASKESSLTALDWLDTSSCFVELICRHLTVGDNAEPGGPDAEAMALMWDSHFRRIQNHPNFAERFELYLEYDMRVRYAYINRPNTFLPSMWHDPLYQAVLKEYYFKQLADWLLIKSSYASTGHSSSALGISSNSTGSTASFHASSSWVLPAVKIILRLMWVTFTVGTRWLALGVGVGLGEGREGQGQPSATRRGSGR